MYCRAANSHCQRLLYLSAVSLNSTALLKLVMLPARHVLTRYLPMIHSEMLVLR